MNKVYLAVDDKRLAVSNLEKDLYPSYGFTKARVLDYYQKIAPAILPHLRDRALTLKRYPQGTEQKYFYEKRCPEHRPAWVRTASVPQEEGGSLNACLVNDLRTLMWVENLASLELHIPLGRVDAPDTPDAMVFDLDPGEPANILDCGRVALILHDLLSSQGLASYVKTSGRKGLHVLVPLNRPETTYEDIKQFSRSVATVMHKHYPDLVTAKMAKKERQARVFINWSQNDASKTMIAVYSLRARERPYVSFPLAWSEVEDLWRQGDAESFQIDHDEALSRVESQGDLFQNMLTKEQKLPFF